MKILISSLLLLFLSGTYSVSIQTQEVKQPPARPSIRESVKGIFHNVMVLGAELVANWDSPEADRRAACEKRMEIIKADYYNFGYGVAEYMIDIYKEVHKEINGSYPVYTTKVIPVFLALGLPIYEGVQSIVKEIQPAVKTFQDQVKIHQYALWEQIRPVVLNKAKPIIDSANEHLKPYIESVRKEVANAKSEEDAKPAAEPEGLAESMKISEILQKVLLFEEEVLKKMQSELFHSKA